jgi:hypothetical protein
MDDLKVIKIFINSMTSLIVAPSINPTILIALPVEEKNIILIQ